MGGLKNTGSPKPKPTVEAEDLACHASKGRTPRTEVMFREGGTVYVYLIYGMYWLLNLVTGNEGDASAVLIRGIEGCLQGLAVLGENFNSTNRSMKRISDQFFPNLG